MAPAKVDPSARFPQTQDGPPRPLPAHSYVATVNRRRSVLVLAAAIVIVALVVFVVAGESLQRSDAPGLVIAGAGLGVALVTLWFVVPTPARVIVDRQDELQLTDLIFYLYEDGALGKVPRAILLQLHMAVANVGGRKAVVSRVRIDRLVNDEGEEVVLPGVPQQIRAAEYRQRTGWRNHERYFENETSGGPWVLASDDVITLRFRFRRGLTWEPAEDLDHLRAYADALRSPIRRAEGTVTWRQGGSVRHDQFQARLETKQQAEYTTALDALTEHFTTRPDVPPRPIHLE